MVWRSINYFIFFVLCFTIFLRSHHASQVPPLPYGVQPPDTTLITFECGRSIWPFDPAGQFVSNVLQDFIGEAPPYFVRGVKPIYIDYHDYPRNFWGVLACYKSASTMVTEAQCYMCLATLVQQLEKKLCVRQFARLVRSGSCLLRDCYLRYSIDEPVVVDKSCPAKPENIIQSQLV